MKSNALIPITISTGQPLVDTRIIAEHCGVQHQSLHELLKDHQATVEEEFGIIRFETGILPGPGKPPRFALLSEDQATFLITLTRNTRQVITFKAALVRAFAEAKRKLAGGAAPVDGGPAAEALALVREFKELGASPDQAVKAASEIVRSVASRKRRAIAEKVPLPNKASRPVNIMFPDNQGGFFSAINAAVKGLKGVQR